MSNDSLLQDYSRLVFNREIANYGDRIIIITGKQKTLTTILTKGVVSQTCFGALKHDDCIGKKYGSKISTSQGFVHILFINPVLWSEALPHRTQIIYATDASLIVGGLDLVPGKWVFEAGTGSGSLTHFLAQAVLPNGHVHTFDFHEDRVKFATSQFREHSLTNSVKVTLRDIYAHYFPPVGEEENPNGVDAIILDLPQPWIVIPHLVRSFNPKSGGRVCIFSPCIEQVQTSCSILHRIGFIHVSTMECLKRDYDIIRATLDIPNMGQPHSSVFLHKGFDEFAEALHKSNRYLLPPQSNGEKLNLKNHKRKIDKNVKNRNESCIDKVINPVAERMDDCDITQSEETGFIWAPLLRSKHPGHTGYLTFATWLPSSPIDLNLVNSNICSKDLEIRQFSDQE